MAEAAGKDRLLYAPIDANNINSYRKINAVTLPVRYSESFYKNVLAVPRGLAQLVFYREVLIGAYACRVEDKDGKKCVYIMTLGILAPYRRRGIGSQILQQIVTVARELGGVQRVLLNVHVDNADAMAFYDRNGFTKGERLVNYYQRITPPDAFSLYFDL